MQPADRPTGAGAILMLIVGIAATGFLGSTLVLGLLGAQTAVVWTGTTGCALLAGWLLAANEVTRRHAKRVASRTGTSAD